MGLTIRLVRSMFVFGLIFVSYTIQIGLVRLFRRLEADPRTGREAMVVPAWLRARRERVDSRNARRLLRGILKLRGVYIKLGQVLSIMGGFLPSVYGKELEPLQDQVPPHPFTDVEATFRASFSRPVRDAYAHFEEVPIASASLGQVHVARLHDGTKVAVKVLYAGIRDVIRIDMRVIRLAIKAYKLFVPVAGIERVHESLVDLLRRETDYLHEAACMERMARNFEGQRDILFPSVVPELTSGDVLTMTFMEGVKITNFEAIAEMGVDRKRLAQRLVQSFYQQVLADRFFHADPHPGNFLVQRDPVSGDPRLVVLDFGAISEVKQEMVDGMIDILQGILGKQGELVLAGFYKMGFVAETGNHELLERTVMTYFQKLLKLDRSAGQLMKASARELEALADPEVARRELRELMRSFEYPDGWFYVERASVLMFWLVGQIDPDLDSLTIGMPYVMPILMERQRQKVAAVG
jgi:predicted unusual protein kinase regulating ubiquinone biosynthesis (AarF/ABC1/UbiB family)